MFAVILAEELADGTLWLTKLFDGFKRVRFAPTADGARARQTADAPATTAGAADDRGGRRVGVVGCCRADKEHCLGVCGAAAK